MIFNLLTAGLTATSFDWTPRFKEVFSIPTVKIHQNTTNIGHDEVTEFTWPIQCKSDSITIEQCKNHEILDDFDFWFNIQDYIENSPNISLYDVPEFASKFTSTWPRNFQF